MNSELACGHTDAQCHPGCWAWGGVSVLPDWYHELAERLIASDVMSTPASRANTGATAQESAA